MGRIDARRLGLIVSWALIGAWGVWALVRLTGIGSGYPLEALLAFTPIVAATAVVPVIAALVARNWAGAAVAAAVLALFAAMVLPRAFGGQTEAEGGNGPELRVLAANVELGKANAADLVELVDHLDVDVLSVEELTPKLVAKLDRAGIARLLGDRVLAPGPRATGSGLYARSGLGPGTTTTMPGGFPMIREALAVAGAPPTEVISVHAAPPVAGQTDDWAVDLDAIPGTADSPLRIALGDFNATLDHAQFRDLIGRGYDDVAATLGDGLTGTWPADRRMPPFAAIDHVLADGRIGIRDYQVEDLKGSDHRAVFAVLALPSS